MSPIVVEQMPPQLWLPPVTTAEYRLLRQETTPGRMVVPFVQSVGHLDHIDLGFYRDTLGPREFEFFVSFAGADALGFTEPDLEVFYPPEA